VSVAEKKERAARKLEELSKKNPFLKPVIIEGRKIAHTWWGKAWNLNLERYADYSNRIGRGRSYLCHGAVLDLQIDSGEVRALVQGSDSRPYSVVIGIKTLNQKTWQTILSQCQGMLESLQDLMNGDFPKAIGEIFTHQDTGLFPSPKEISFSCSCPDIAGMCKHVAASLYGIGARLDESPELFFKMRKVAMDELIRQAVTDRKEKLLAKASRRSSRVLDEVDLSATFGIDLHQDAPAIASAPSVAPASPKPSARKKAAPEPASEAKPEKKSPKTAKAAKTLRKAAAEKAAPSVAFASAKPRQREKTVEPVAEAKTAEKSRKTAKVAKPSRKPVSKETAPAKTKTGKEKKSASKTRKGMPKAL
jgi:uncharacterized Zn finger protein